MQHRDIIIKGRVQGVGFRHFARQQARAYGIKGFVKNQPDGSVFIEAEGDKENLSEFIRACKKGPGWSNVDDMDTREGEIKNYSSFEVRY